MAVERAASVAPTKELASAIRQAGDEWKRATVGNATNELKRELQDIAEATAFETRLLGMNAKERAVANVEREIELWERLEIFVHEGHTFHRVFFNHRLPRHADKCHAHRLDTRLVRTVDVGFFLVEIAPSAIFA